MAGPTALLVVHGIGAQERGETLDKLASGLRLLDPGFNPQATDDGVTATIGDQPVRLYEVYWADCLKGDITRGTFLLNELQSLSWFPWFNLRRGNYTAARYPIARLAWWTLALPVLNFFVLFAYYGAATIAQVFQPDRARTATRARPTALDRVLDEYAGDVLNYVNSAGNAFHRDRNEPAVPEDVRTAFPRIARSFYTQLLKAHADGCETIQVVAHSLGTVIAYHALSGFAAAPSGTDTTQIAAAIARVRRLYTLGCPLEKIRFFWPRLMPFRTAAADCAVRWENFVSFFDPVSGHVRSFTDWGTVTNHRLLGGGFFSGHVVYERSPVFLRALAEGVCGHAVGFERRGRQSLRDLLLLGGETLAAPVAVAMVLALGASLFAVVGMMIPYLLSWTVRWFMPAERWAPVIDTMSLVFLGMMVLAFLVGPAVRASRVHARFWTASDASR